ncbi:MAG: (deoxy)nucleoside triphosphate pyrophosphohydrolase [Porphyrobacter sp.]|nr:(deoxy)nucleoside triphosphate pyrophosphohydrolase [Porphyrobacter sp.]
MARNPTCLLVVAAAIRDAAGHLLLQQALPGKPHAGQWEFPGGKVEARENPRFALRREIAEELGLTLEEAAMVPAGFADRTGAPQQPAIVLILYECPVWAGQPQSREGQAWGWFTFAEAEALPMAAADRALLEGLAR